MQAMQQVAGATEMTVTVERQDSSTTSMSACQNNELE
jgi:hypothetical protein